MNWVQVDRQHVWHPFTQEQTAPLPVEISSAKGAWLQAQDGRRFLDLVSSWWVNLHGHAHPVIAEAIAKQAHTLEQVMFAGFTHQPAAQLAYELVQRLPAGLSRVFYSDNGSTAIEVALKIALQYWRNQGQNRKRFAVFDGSYHGDTVGAMSVGQGSQFFTHYQALLFDVDILPYPLTWEGDPHVEQKEAVALQAFDAYLQRYPNEVAGVLIEPLVQGASGMRMCRPQFLQGLAKRVKEAKVLLLFDEVMTGFGRTGQWFASHTAQVTPDLICLSKGITAGFLPLSVTVCSEPVYEAFLGETFDRAFVHGHSFTANPLGCAAALASLKVFEQESTLAKLPQIESWHREYLAPLMTHPKVEQVRICGTIAAFNVKASESTYGSSLGERLKGVFMEQGVLMRPLGNTVYLLPPYCITKDELALGYQAIDKALAII